MEKEGGLGTGRRSMGLALYESKMREEAAIWQNLCRRASRLVGMGCLVRARKEMSMACEVGRCNRKGDRGIQ